MKDPSCRELKPKRRQMIETRSNSRERESKYLALESCLSDPYVVYDLEGRVLQVNSRFEDTFGWTLDELRGRALPFVPTDEQAASLQNFEETLAGRGKPFGTLRLTKAGALLKVTISACRFVNSEGVPAGLVSVIRNSNAKDNPSAEGDSPDGHTGGPFQLLEAKLELSKGSVSDEPAGIREVVRLLIHLVQGQRSDLQARISHNLAITVKPLIAHLQCLDLTEAQTRLVETLDFNITHIASYFGATVSDNDARLSPREIQICQMIRSSQKSREIAQRLGVTYQTVIVHRKNIRKKLGLKRIKGNLASYIRERM